MIVIIEITIMSKQIVIFFKLSITLHVTLERSLTFHLGGLSVIFRQVWSDRTQH